MGWAAQPSFGRADIAVCRKCHRLRSILGTFWRLHRQNKYLLRNLNGRSSRCTHRSHHGDISSTLSDDVFGHNPQLSVLVAPCRHDAFGWQDQISLLLVVLGRSWLKLQPLPCMNSGKHLDPESFLPPSPTPTTHYLTHNPHPIHKTIHHIFITSNIVATRS